MTEGAQIARFRANIMRAELAKLDGEGDSRLVTMMRTLLAEGRVWVDGARMRNLHRLCERYAGTAGAFVECGVAMGGCLSVMAEFAGLGRLVWGFDSFEGMPGLVEEDEGAGEAWVGVSCSGNEGERSVRRTFELTNVSMANVRVVKGWFEDCLPARRGEVGAIAILRLDADWYEATRECLDQLYDSVIPGGAIVVDDYFSFRGCQRAVDEFRERRGAGGELRVTDRNSEVFWIKS